MKKFVVLLIVISSIFVFSVQAYATERLSGINRTDTAVEVSKKGWENGADTVVLARNDEFPDALSGSVLAYQKNAPILLTQGDELSSVTSKEVKRLNPSEVIILGGENAISESVLFEIKDILSEVTFDRIAGKNRYETAVEIADSLDPHKSEYSKMISVLVNGRNFPDAISVASYAAQKGMPILLTKKDSLPGVTKDYYENGGLKKKLYIIGGTGVVSNEVKNEVYHFYLQDKIRLAGKDRYETNYEVNSYFEEEYNQAFFATGTKYPDALTGSVLAAKSNAPIILSEPNEKPESIEPLLPKYKEFTILGGYGAISENIEQSLDYHENN
ncbi:cell wall-binding repeat-containing protein [Halobacillus sp. HZG1]|uniref:cell wall-binding repeat-containing protein n=1 Tax=Halobacillus sp. HZG1 TaxID=3111769 RepID=UPI002DBE52E5|nr:cell wall-binding repeat-containing protein [Halobacillus sp. HZG1]MEC3884594.1 cell wall-binding repeat-containing protein [Halobacillus sp. HZG1]